jgi:hypothetical protein
MLWEPADCVKFMHIQVLNGPQKTSSAQVGDFFAGISATLAFIWLIAGFLLQTKELGLQRKSLDLQKEELKKIAELSTCPCF